MTICLNNNQTKHLKNLLNYILELEELDFLDCMYEGDYKNNLTQKEHQDLYNFARNDEIIDESLLLTCNHAYSLAAYFQKIILDMEKK